MRSNTFYLLLTVLLLTGCGKADSSHPAEFPAYETVIPPDRREAAAAWVTATVAAANPYSDEEPEDNIEAAQAAALQLFGEPTLGLRTRRNGVWTFVPIDSLPPEKQAPVRIWAATTP